MVGGELGEGLGISGILPPAERRRPRLDHPRRPQHGAPGSDDGGLDEQGQGQDGDTYEDDMPEVAYRVSDRLHGLHHEPPPRLTPFPEIDETIQMWPRRAVTYPLENEQHDVRCRVLDEPRPLPPHPPFPPRCAAPHSPQSPPSAPAVPERVGPSAASVDSRAASSASAVVPYLLGRAHALAPGRAIHLG